MGRSERPLTEARASRLEKYQIRARWRTVAYDVFDGKQTDVWVNDWSRDRLTRLTTSTTYSTMPVWTPDGRRIAFASQRGEKAINTTFNLTGSGQTGRVTCSG
jgi:Tol biopolymer transport system component